MIKITIKNKKADSRWLSPWMIVQWIIIIGALLLISYWFFPGFNDVRVKEAEKMNNVLLNCLAKDFSISEIQKDSFNIFEKCSLNKDLFSSQQIYYFEIIIDDSAGKEVRDIQAGVNWKTECLYQKENNKAETKLAQCFVNTLYVLDKKTGLKYSVQAITGSNQK